MAETVCVCLSQYSCCRHHSLFSVHCQILDLHWSFSTSKYVIGRMPSSVHQYWLVKGQLFNQMSLRAQSLPGRVCLGRFTSHWILIHPHGQAFSITASAHHLFTWHLIFHAMSHIQPCMCKDLCKYVHPEHSQCESSQAFRPSSPETLT